MELPTKSENRFDATRKRQDFHPTAHSKEENLYCSGLASRAPDSFQVQLGVE